MPYDSGYKIAIDGPAGSGKSTIAKLLAKDLGFTYIDSGAMYRAVTFYLVKKNLLDISEGKLNKHLRKMKIKFGKNSRVFLNNTDVTRKIRLKIVNRYVSMVSARRPVRIEMVQRQRELAKKSNVVMDGRDIGSVVFPHADLKIYLTASALERARRRKKDLLKLGEKVSLTKLVNEIHERDVYDSSRQLSPLSKPQDAVVLDTTMLSINQVIERIKVFLPC